MERVPHAGRLRRRGVIAEKDRPAQRKIIKYNRLLANCLLFYTVAAMSRALADLRAEGSPIELEVAAPLSPYMRVHYIRFGRFSLDLTRELMPLDYDPPILSTPPGHIPSYPGRMNHSEGYCQLNGSVTYDEGSVKGRIP